MPKGTAREHDALYFHYRGMSAIRSGEPWPLFDLATDISGRRNLASREPRRVPALRKKFEAWLAEFPALPD